MSWVSLTNWLKGAIMEILPIKVTPITDYLNNFSAYDTRYTPTIYQFGPIVWLVGAFGNTQTVNSSTTQITMAMLPDDVPAPPKNIDIVCQGSMRNIWLCTISSSNRNILFGRYRESGSWTSPSAGTWFPISIIWLDPSWLPL